MYIDKKETIKLIELFAGIGSQTQALKNIEVNHEVVAISEIDKYALVAYQAIHGEVNNLGDITAIEELPPCDLLTYSFPCQDLSVAGKGAGIKQGTRSGLLFEVERLLMVYAEKNQLPDVLLLENVKNLVGKNHKKDFDIWLEKLNNLGYHTFWEVMNAKDHNTPQNRERVFAVSILDSTFNYVFPEKEPLKVTLQDLLEDDVDESYFLTETQIQNILKSNFKTTARRIQKKNYIDTLCARDYKDPKCVEVFDFRYDKGVRLRKNGLSPTLRTCSGGISSQPLVTTFETLDSIITLGNYSPSEHNLRVRKITPLESWRLMGQSDENFFKARQALNDTFYNGKDRSKSALYKLAGNSIVVKVLEKIFTKLYKV